MPVYEASAGGGPGEAAAGSSQGYSLDDLLADLTDPKIAGLGSQKVLDEQG